MELSTGICGICSSNSLILNSVSSENYCNMIYSHFEKELNISTESKTYFNLCPTCVYQITLINSKKNLLARDSSEDEEISSDKCALCKENEESFIISEKNFLSKCKPWISIEDIVSICASCFYIIEINNVLKKHIMEKLSLKDDCSDNQKFPPKSRTILRRKSTYEEAGSSKGTETTNPESKTSEGKKRKHSEEPDLTEASTPVKKTPVKRRRGKNLAELLDEESKTAESKNSSKGDNIFQDGFNLSSIFNLSPLCKTNLCIDQKHMLDEKMYNCIPFVKMQNLEETSIQKDEGSYVCSLISQRPMIRVRRTPPIKIKTIRNVNIKTNKKSSPEKKSNPSISDIQKQKLIVKVERMKLDIPEKTPKKKKRVHFNDTPTIIITEDDYYDDFRAKRNTRNSPEKPDIKKMEIEEETVNNEEERSDSEELITLALEESDDETIEDSKLQSNENNPGENEEAETESQASVETTSMDTNSENIEESTESEHKTSKVVKTDKLEQDKGSSDEKGKEATHDEEENSNDGETVEDEENSENNEEVHNETEQTSENEKNISNEIEIVQCEDDDNSETEVDEKTSEDGKDSADVCEIVDSEDGSENDKAVDKTTAESSEDGKDEIVDLEEVIDLDEESNDKSVKKSSCVETIDLQDDESKDGVEETDPKMDLQDNSGDESAETIGNKKKGNAEKNNEDTEKDDEDTEKDDEDTEKDDEDTKKDNDDNEETDKDREDAEKDSLDGFEVIDQEDGETEKVSSDKPEESTDDIDEIESLVRKYCEEDEKNKSGTEKENNIQDDDEENSPEKPNSQEEKENKSDKQKKEGEDFGMLIDEVQKCLTSTKDLLEKTEGGTGEVQSEDSIPSAKELAEILNSSFDDDATCTENASGTDAVNGNRGVKRKSSEEKLEESDNKKEKKYISGV